MCPGGPSGSFSLDGVTVTFGAPKRDSGGQDASLKPGTIFQDVHVTMSNHGKYHYEYNSLDFALLDAGAHDYQEAGAYNNNLAQPLNTGKLGPGQTISGDLSFIVPATATPAAIRWIPTGLGLDDPNSNLTITDYLVRLPGYAGSAAPCPAGPLGATTVAGVTLKIGALTPEKGATSIPLKPGTAFRVLHVTLIDHGPFHYEYNPNDFTVMDAGARLYAQATAYDDNLAQPLDTGKLGPGQHLSGELAFVLPKTLRAMAIRWQPTGLGLDDQTHPDVGDYIVRLP